MRARGLDRTLSVLGCYLVMATSEEILRKEMARLTCEPKNQPDMPKAGVYAQVSKLETDDGKRLAVVTTADLSEFDGIRIAGILAHEAVHVWQYHKEITGEREPGKEQEAYAIQFIFLELMTEYARQKGLK